MRAGFSMSDVHSHLDIMLRRGWIFGISYNDKLGIFLVSVTYSNDSGTRISSNGQADDLARAIWNAFSHIPPAYDLTEN